ncbi:gamma-glutamyl-gamma-aminobutyrate hydrolase family protein [Bradyrhizobium sp. USDA 4503]
MHRDWLRRKYVKALLHQAGVACVILPTIDAEDASVETAPAIMQALDGLVLTGDESNIDPAVLTAPASCPGADQQDIENGIRDRRAGQAIRGSDQERHCAGNADPGHLPRAAGAQRLFRRHASLIP